MTSKRAVSAVRTFRAYERRFRSVVRRFRVLARRRDLEERKSRVVARSSAPISGISATVAREPHGPVDGFEEDLRKLQHEWSL